MAFQSVTLTTLQAELANKWDNVPFWTAEEARTALNEGLRMWNAITGYWRNRITLLTIPNDNYLPLPGNLAYKSRVEFNGSPLAPSSLLGLDSGRPSWEGETTITAGVPSAPKIWAPVSTDLIVIWPADHLGFGTLTIDGMAQTPVLVNGGDFVDLGQEEHNQLLGYALHVASFKHGGQLFESTKHLYEAWVKAAGERNEQFKASSLYRKVLNIDQGRDRLPISADASDKHPRR
jgi:hypothetical protein